MFVSSARVRRKLAPQTAELPAPLGGLNLVDAHMSIGPEHALRLDNWVVRRDGLWVRQGYDIVHRPADDDGEASDAKRVRFLHGCAGKALWATQDTFFYDGHLLAVGFASGNWSAEAMANEAGPWLVLCNGDDAPQVFTGGAIATADITDVDKRKLISPTYYNARMFFGEQGGRSIWYLAPYAMHGEATEYPLDPLMKKGGVISGTGIMSNDGGHGPDDLFLIVTTVGELIAFSGIDPDQSETWSLIGVWDVPIPVGSDPLVEHGGTALLITQDGVLDVQALMQASADREQATAVTAMLGRHGGTCFVASHQHKLAIFAQDDGTAFIRDGQTGAWSRWKDLNATAWANIGDELWFGQDNGRVCKYGAAWDMDGSNDGYGAPIDADFVQGFSDFGSSRNKRFSRAAAVFRHFAPDNSSMRMFCDFDDLPDLDDPKTINQAYARWDEARWGDPWEKRPKLRMTRWHDIRAYGYAGAFAMSVRTRAPMVYQNAKIRMELGGI